MHPTKFDSVYAINCLWNRYLAQIGLPNSQRTVSNQAVQAPKGSTSNSWQKACTTGKMSTTLLSSCNSELGANSVHGWKAIQQRTSPQSPEQQVLGHAEALCTSAIVEHCQNPKSVMVWARICVTGKTPLVFIIERVKIYQNVYRREILDAVVFPWACRQFGQQEWTLTKIPLQPTEQKRYRSNAKPFPEFTSAEWPRY